MKRLYIGIALLLTITVVAQTAGDTLRREVIIEKDFTPIVRDASKINTLPEVEELTVTKQSISYSDWVAPTTLQSTGAWVPPAGFEASTKSNERKGYLDFAIGTHWNIIGNAGYRILQTEKDQLNVWFQHRSTNGTVSYNQKLPDYSRKRHMRQLSEQLLADYSHSFKNIDLGVQTGYRYNSFNYYGLRSSSLSTPLTTGQHLHRFFLKGDIASTDTHLGMYYKASLAYYRMGFGRGYMQGEPGVGENDWRADFLLSAPFDSTRSIKVEGELAYLNYTQKHAPSTNYAMLSLSPRYQWRNERMALSVGLRADISFNQGAIFRFAPNVRFDWEITSGVDFYAQLTGGKTLNTWRKVSGYTLYFNPSELLPNTYTPIDFSLGFRTNLLPGFSWGISGGYDWSSNALFFLPGIDESGLLTGVAQAVGINAHAIKTSVEASYRYGTKVEAKAQIDYCYRIAYGKAISYDRPRWAGSLTARYLPLNPLAIELGYQFATDRSFAPLTPSKLKDKHLVHLKGSYQFNSQFSLYGVIDNMFNCKYDILYGMPAQGICFMAGFDFKF